MALMLGISATFDCGRKRMGRARAIRRALIRLIDAYRGLGHLLARLDLLSDPPASHPLLDLSQFGLTETRPRSRLRRQPFRRPDARRRASNSSTRCARPIAARSACCSRSSCTPGTSARSASRSKAPRRSSRCSTRSSRRPADDGRQRDRHGHGPPRPAQRAGQHPRQALRGDLQRVRGQLPARLDRRRRRREVPPRLLRRPRHRGAATASTCR